MTNKAAIYIRVSTQYQIDKDSIVVQRRELEAYSKLVLGIDDTEVFEDPGYSAKNTDRPAYQNMMRRIRNGEFSHLVVWKIDRISRNLLDFSNMYAELKKIGVTFISKNEQFDTSSAIGEAMLKIILVFAELERKMTAERVTAVMLSRANEGQWNGGQVPFGFKTVGEKLVRNDEEYKTYMKIIDTYESVRSISHTAVEMNNLGLRTRRGGTWSRSAIYGILTNEFYTGVYTYNRRNLERGFIRDESEWIRVENHHEAFISQERYERIINTLKSQCREKGGTYTRMKNIHIFSGIIHCAKCGNSMFANKKIYKDKVYFTYSCSGRKANPKSCNNSYIREEYVGAFIFRLISNIISANVTKNTTIDAFTKQLTRGMNVVCEKEGTALLLRHLKTQSIINYNPENIFSKSAAEKEDIQAQITKNETALTRLKTLYLYGEASMPEKDYITERTKIENELKKLRESLAKTTTESPFITSKESYEIMVKWLYDDKGISYTDIMSTIDKTVPKNFILSIIKDIKADNGFISEVDFKNGVTLKFQRK